MGAQPAGRLYLPLRTWPCTAQTDALCQHATSNVQVAKKKKPPAGGSQF
jgi:hypothetical protein